MNPKNWRRAKFMKAEFLLLRLSALIALASPCLEHSISHSSSSNSLAKNDCAVPTQTPCVYVHNNTYISLEKKLSSKKNVISVKSAIVYYKISIAVEKGVLWIHFSNHAPAQGHLAWRHWRWHARGIKKKLIKPCSSGRWISFLTRRLSLNRACRTLGSFLECLLI